MAVVEQAKVDELIMQADRAVKGMRAASDGKPPETLTETNASTFAALAVLMEQLVTLAKRDRAENKRMAEALDRVATLRVRSAAQLIEQRNWHKIMTEVQAVAQDAIAKAQ